MSKFVESLGPVPGESAGFLVCSAFESIGFNLCCFGVREVVPSAYFPGLVYCQHGSESGEKEGDKSVVGMLTANAVFETHHHDRYVVVGFGRVTSAKRELVGGVCL
jgi:hypothetical protein